MRRPKNHLKKLLYSLDSRCKPNGSYGRKGIQNFLTLKDLQYLWKKYRAWELRYPCIHRKNNEHNYYLENTMFIASEEHNRLHIYLRQIKRLKMKLARANDIIKQYELIHDPSDEPLKYGETPKGVRVL